MRAQYSKTLKMADSSLRRVLLGPPPFSAVSRCAGALYSTYHERRAYYAASTTTDSVTEGETEKNKKKEGKWLTLPPFTSIVDGTALGREIAGRNSAAKDETTTSMTALKWVVKCCPQLPRSLVQKLFRLRQVRRESSNIANSDVNTKVQQPQIERVAAKHTMEFGDRILLPVTVQELPVEKAECHFTEEQNFVHGLEIYKDSAILVINKPPGMPVQGGIGIKRSIDTLAETYLKHDFSEAPRLLGV